MEMGRREFEQAARDQNDARNAQVADARAQAGEPMTRHWTAALARLSACDDGYAWAKGHGSLQSAWDACERPDWMLWYLGKIGVDRKLMVLLACDCAATAMPIWAKRYPNDRRPQDAIRIARAWARGKATIEQVKEARRSAYAAYAAAYAADAAYAAYAAAAAAYAAAADAQRKANRRMAALIRKRVPNPMEVAK